MASLGMRWLVEKTPWNQPVHELADWAKVQQQVEGGLLDNWHSTSFGWPGGVQKQMLRGKAALLEACSENWWSDQLHRCSSKVRTAIRRSPDSKDTSASSSMWLSEVGACAQHHMLEFHDGPKSFRSLSLPVGHLAPQPRHWPWIPSYLRAVKNMLGRCT